MFKIALITALTFALSLADDRKKRQVPGMLGSGPASMGTGLMSQGGLNGISGISGINGVSGLTGLNGMSGFSGLTNGPFPSNGINVCLSVLDCAGAQRCCGNVSGGGLLSSILGGTSGTLGKLPVLGGLVGRCSPICLLGEINL
ncbi:unnamed protein product, partial [Mesorhabditis belari]|uniref:Hydrophobin n=1 Tax=Mesorhabditis belari TaxID=2138241 RepID=A0AAF3EKP9_9BILA